MTMILTPDQLQIERLKAPAVVQNEELEAVESVVRGIISAVRERGDDAVREYSRAFDKYEGQALEISDAEREAAVAALDPQTRADTEFAIARVKAFAQAQLATINPWRSRNWLACTWATASFQSSASVRMCLAVAIRSSRHRS